MLWLPLALATAVAFGVYNFAIKLASSRMDQVLGAVTLQLVAALLGGSFALLLRLGGRDFAISGTGLGWACVAGAAVGVAEILTFLVFLRGAPVSIATPIIMGGSVVVAALLGLIFLRESLGPLQLGGVVLVAAGVALLSAGSST